VLVKFTVGASRSTAHQGLVSRSECAVLYTRSPSLPFIAPVDHGIASVLTWNEGLWSATFSRTSSETAQHSTLDHRFKLLENDTSLHLHQSLFRRILNHETHVLHQLLPEKTNCIYTTCALDNMIVKNRKSTHVNDTLFFY